MKVKIWLKNKIYKILDINNLIKQQKQQELRIKNIENLIKVGIDIHHKSDSWAVFCIERIKGFTTNYKSI